VALRGVGRVAVALRDRQLGGWLAALLEEVVRGAPESFVDEALRVPEPRARRLFYDLAAPGLAFDRLLDAARHDPDLPVRVRCASEAVRVATSRGDVDSLRPLLRSGTAFVRAAVIHALARAGSPSEAVAALGDRSAAVRAVAQADARRAGVDPAAWYRSAVPTAATVAGLGETGTAADDAPLVRASLADPRPAVRRAAVRALRRLGAVEESLASLLTDTSPGVAREVSAALRSLAGRVDAVPLLDPAYPPHVRRAAADLLRQRDAETRVRTDLALLADPDLGAAALADLRTWLRQDAVNAYLSLGDTIEEPLRRAASLLSEEDVRLLRFFTR
jgi:HEAT repeat protein